MLHPEHKKRFVQNDLTYTLLFGLLSVALSKVQFHIPGVGNSNLREIPLLISLFHLRNFYSVFLLSLFVLLGSPTGVSYWEAYGVHLIPLLIVAAIFKTFDRKHFPAVMKGAMWMAVTIGYYVLLLVPLVTLTLSRTGGGDKDFWVLYQSILSAIRFEAITSSLVTGLYLMQIETHKALEVYSHNLEEVVEQRTKDLMHANNELRSLNEELTTSNEGIKKLNENLEQMVKERTEQIGGQLIQLRKYARMNSHELRAPLSRMLGLLELMRHEQDENQMKELLGHLNESSKELDLVIREMNKLLEREINPS